ncbi:hypothetical protein [Pedobacter ginsengisoli]|uniref:hypothetical protein n=1 Tax=Pedobacter ginsengisoli TaxID=363852 RepID=UPI0012FE40AF|nr:hypothetical protein [Pedobacter ginsengisoli]
METRNKKKLVIEPEVVFEIKNTYQNDPPDDPTTSLATTTFTHLFTFGGHYHQKDVRK